MSSKKEVESAHKFIHQGVNTAMAEEQIDKSKMRLGDVLSHKGFVTPQQLQQEKAFKQQKETGLRLGEQLIALGMVTEENILGVLCWQPRHL